MVLDRYQCSNSECKAIEGEMVYPKVIHEVDASSVNRNVQELIDLSLQDDPQHERLFKNCNIPITRYQLFCSTSDIFVIKITPNKETDRRTKKLTQVKQIPTRPIKLGKHTYKFRSMITHCDELGEFTAHYIALVKKNRRWLNLSDEEVSVEPQWPQNGSHL